MAEVTKNEGNLVIFRLLDRKADPTSFFLNPDGSHDLTRKLDFTNTYGVLNPYWIYGPKGERLDQRYILGCAFFDVRKQDKEKYIANLRNTLVEFQKGADIIINDVKMAPLVEWLRAHPWLKDGPNHNPDLHDAIFMEFDAKKLIKEEIAKSSDQDDAFELVLSFKNDVSKLQAIKMFFVETKDLTDPEEIYLGLRHKAMTEPVLFMKSIASQEEQALANVLLGLTLGVIDKNEKGAFFTETQLVFFPLDGIAQKAADKRIADFLLSKEGSDYYRNLLLKIEQKKLELDAPKTE